MGLRQIGGCENGTCPKVFEETHSQDVIVQGYTVHEPSTLHGVGHVPSGEHVVRIPREVFAQAARAIRQA